MESAFGVEHFSKMVVKIPRKLPKGVKRKVKIVTVNGTTRVGTLTPASVAVRSAAALHGGA